MTKPFDHQALIDDCRATIAETDAVVAKIQQESRLRTAACAESRTEKEPANGELTSLLGPFVLSLALTRKART